MRRMTASAADGRRLYLHVGVPKSGTTFLQRALLRNQEGLREAGFLYPGSDHEEMFRAAIEIRESHETWGRRPEDTAGSWTRLCAQARSFDGTTIISHEILGAATPEQAATAVKDLDGLDVHVIVTARDLGRQLTASWQEAIKNGSTSTFAKFRDKLMSDIDAGRMTGWFWRAQCVPDVLERWSSVVPVEKVHVIPCPPPDADPLELWRRFADVVGFDADGFDPTTPTSSSNESLGVVQIALLREVNRALAGRLVQPTYGRVVKRYLAQNLLPVHRSRRPTYPVDMYDVLRDLALKWNAEIESGGYQVHGDLAELLPVAPPPDVAPLDDVDPREELETAVAVISELLVEVASLRGQLWNARRTIRNRRPNVVRRVLARLR